MLNSLCHRKCGVQGFIPDLFASKTLNERGNNYNDNDNDYNHNNHNSNNNNNDNNNNDDDDDNNNIKFVSPHCNSKTKNKGG